MGILNFEMIDSISKADNVSLILVLTPGKVNLCCEFIEEGTYMLQLIL